MGCCGESSRVSTARVNGKELAPPGDELLGPTKNRRLRDVFFLLLFILGCIGGIVYLGVASYKGDPNRLIHGYDAYGNVCGQKNPKYFDVEKSGEDKTCCSYLEVESVVVSSSFNARLQGKCTEKCGTDTKIGYYCINFDESLNLLNNTALSDVLKSPFKKIGMNLAESWHQIILICLIGLALSIVFTLMLRFLATIVIWISIAALVLGSIGGTVYLWVYRHQQIQKLEKMKTEKTTDVRIPDMETYIQNLLVGAIVATVFTILLIVVLIALRNRIRLVIQLFVEAGKAIAAMPLLMIQPLWTMIIMTIALASWLFGWLLILSSGDPEKYGDSGIIFQLDPVIDYMRWYHIFIIFWVTQFIIGCQHMTIAGAVCAWYFERDKEKLKSPIIRSLGNLIKYHLGSVALGSLIIAIVQIINAILKYITKKFSSFNSGPGKWLCCCCQCCMNMFESFIKFVSRNGYIEIAIYGLGFCASCKKAFKVITNNALRITAINLIGDFLLLITKLAVVISTTFIGIEIVKIVETVDNIWPAVIIGALFTFIIAHCFISVYEMTIDTLFVCFCEDCEKNDGISKPYFMSKGLMQFVENSQAALDALNKRSQGHSAPKASSQPMQVLAIPVVMYPGEVSPRSSISVTGIDPKTGMTPLHPPYKPASEPPTPSRLMSPPL